MAFTTDDFGKIWASTSPLTPYEFSESNYKEGWNFIGATPPSRQMWDFLQKQNDEKSEWLYNAHNDIIDLLKTLIPTGCVQAFAGITIPSGWLLCDGSAVSRTDYAALYAVIGDTYGAGDGTSTFNLPNMGGRVPIGVGTGTDSRETNTYNVGAIGGEYSHQLIVAEMPSHEHQVTWLRDYPLSLNSGDISGYNLDWGSNVKDTDGIVANAVGGDGLHNNVQPYLALNYIIKY